MTTQQRQPRRPKASRKRLYLSILGLGIAFLVFYYPLHWALKPWAVALPGKPALAGYWTGTVSFAPGDERRIVLHIVGEPPGRGRGGPDIDGAAKVCGATQNTRYEVWGGPDNYAGTRFTLRTRSSTDGPGRYLNGLTNGEWDGQHLLTVQTTLTTREADGSSRSVTGTDQPPDPPLRFQLHRGSEAEFTAAC
jgi:hypothetical protein